MNSKQKPLAELTEEALHVLHREFGTADTIRFLRQFSTGFGNYTDERAAASDESLDEVIDAIKARRNERRKDQKKEQK